MLEHHSTRVQAVRSLGAIANMEAACADTRMNANYRMNHHYVFGQIRAKSLKMLKSPALFGSVKYAAKKKRKIPHIAQLYKTRTEKPTHTQHSTAIALLPDQTYIMRTGAAQ